MSLSLKAIFERKKPDPEELQAIDSARVALQERVERLMRQNSTRQTQTQVTDSFGRSLQ